MRSTISFLLISLALGVSTLHAQSPAQDLVVPAAVDATVPKATAVTPDETNLAPVLKALQAMKAANEETLQKQAATLSQLEEIEKNADQVRIFSRRSS